MDAFSSAFVLIWWLVGISPSVLSVPPASLGHAILAQPAFYILAALPVGALAGWRRVSPRWRGAAAGLLAMFAVRFGVINLRLAVAISILGCIAPFFGSAEFIRQKHQRKVRARERLAG